MSKLTELTKEIKVSEFESDLIDDIREYLKDRKFGKVVIGFREGQLASLEFQQTKDVRPYNE